MEPIKNQPRKKLKRPEELTHRNEKVNPYSGKIFDHDDMIWFSGKEQAQGLEDFLHGKILVDLGCGSGNFLRQYAQHLPDWRFIGFEIRFKRLVRATEKYKRDGLDNIRLIRGMAEEITQWFGPESLDVVHVNFPDPWAKERQKKHRLISELFLEQMHYLLKPGGKFIFKTDHEEYYDSSLPLIEASKLSIVQRSRDLHKTDIFNLKTEFEKLFESKGMPIYYVETQKN